MLATTFCCRGSATKMVIILFYISTRRQQRRGDGQTASILKFNWPKLIRWEMAENCPLFPAVSLCSAGTGDSQVCGANSVISSAEVRSVQNIVQNAASSCDMQRTRACDKLYPHQAVSAWPVTTCRDMQMWKYSSKPEFYCSEQVTFAPHQHQCQPSSSTKTMPGPRNQLCSFH